MLYNWKTAFSDKHFRDRFISSVFAVTVILTGFASLLAYIETRQGHTFYDPILNFITPRDVSDFILFLTSAIAVSIGVVVQHVHYSYDVIAAPIFAYIAYRVITKFSKHYYSEVTEEV